MCCRRLSSYRCFLLRCDSKSTQRIHRRNAPDRFERRPQLEVRRLKTMLSPTDLESVLLIQQIRECEKCANIRYKNFFMHLTFSSSCSLSIFLLIYIMFVNAYAFFFYSMWVHCICGTRAYFYVIIVSFSVLIFVKKKKKVHHPDFNVFVSCVCNNRNYCYKTCVCVVSFYQ